MNFLYDFTIVVLATGKYYSLGIDFFNQLKAAEERNNSTTKIQYIILSDKNEDPGSYIEHFYIPHEKWPSVTLSKYKYLLKFFNKFRGEYLILQDADTSVSKKYTDLNIFRKDVAVCQHWMNAEWKKKKERPDYEKRVESKAFISDDKLYTKPYVLGAFFAGKMPNIKDIILSINSNIEFDKNNNICAKWDDESHLNYFVVNNDVEIIPFSKYSNIFISSTKGKLNNELNNDKRFKYNR